MEHAVTAAPRLRRAQGTDLPLLACWGTEAGLNMRLSALTQHLAAPGARIWAAEDPYGALVGGLVAHQVDGELEIYDLIVAPHQRGRGYATALVRTALVADTPPPHRCVLEVAQDNLAARGVYARCGFVQVGLRRGYYARAGGPPCDAAVYAWEKV